ncbi:PTS sugar transporter subunit IIA [Neorhizobium galegae]|uniref:PTS sugar transporter subunit IIA n=1 Tax=Neorhizobium galegae TaxID=399 RepID=UPI000621FFD7|nr:PTS sugar transporter subunit IIA [Neorhizobium galegae]CDZ28502.1 Putative PTS IIA-like nitrogen-regulatory protein PtsN [Neorhizobium galegae bv. officinalis]KAA9386005.1 PTS sugar transporter subunit IIA [Neorhizobium galegae]KAB1113554.1 PTS sugar transporter subunit IIA [Neorhizobium galegae]MCM2496523.1 PTS sugar transporter subunit IIA [Neorhizobium galegae]MCQ1777247.1 PTS sugar transporter subunit IIA [Neorhizobium galegae]
MKLGDYLPPENIVLDLAPPSKAILIKQLSILAAERLALDAGEIVRVLTNRETLGSTGIGAGIAIPHANVKGLDRHFCLFARLAKPVDFEAVDDEPVDLVFLLLNPENRPDHLNILSCIARRVREEETAAAIRRVTTPQDVYSRLCPLNA